MVYKRWGRNKKQADERLSSDLYTTQDAATAVNVERIFRFAQ
jgi:hypothetical protein